MLRILLLIFILLQVACGNGGSLSLESGALGFSANGEFKGSCLSTGTPLVLTEGYCTEFYRVAGSASNPTQECTQAFGFIELNKCTIIDQTNGRCYMPVNEDTNVVYFAASANGPTLCSAAGGRWQAGTKF